ncbi:hypothetical protein ACFLTH_00915 [Bacteroidota bacterium]
MKEKIIKTAAGLMLAIILFILPDIRIPFLDNNADEYFETAMTEAAIAYGTTRVINASISVLQESQIQVEPAGVGLSLAVGQVLDPVNDMTERLSDVLVTAIVSLGIQKLAFEIGISVVPKILAIILIFLSIFIWFNNDNIAILNRGLLRIAFLVIILRLFLPLSSLANDFLNATYFDSRIEQAESSLEFYSKEIDTITAMDFPDGEEGIWGTIKSSALFLGQKAVEFKDALISVVDNVGDIVESLLELTWLYLALFMIQVIFLPLVMFWLLIKMVNGLFRTSFPTLIQHSPGKEDNNKVDVN